MMTRRRFLSHTCTLGMASATLSSTLLQLGLARTAAAATPGYRALVCILLAGGNDSYNMLVPVDADQYAEYQALRSDLALAPGSAAAAGRYHGQRTALRRAPGHAGTAGPVRRRRCGHDRQRRHAAGALRRSRRCSRQRQPAAGPVLAFRPDQPVADSASPTSASRRAGAGGSPT